MYTIAINISEENFKKYSRSEMNVDDSVEISTIQFLSNLALSALLKKNNGVIDISPDVFDNLNVTEEEMVQHFMVHLGGVAIVAEAHNRKLEKTNDN